MKVLITGSNGLLGQKLIDLGLRESGIEWVATSRGPNRHPQTSGYRYVTMDISNQQEVQQVMAKEQPDVVIHTAAMTNVDACHFDHQTCDLLNVDAVQYLIDACNQSNAHLIHVSTDFVFNGKHGPLDESEKPDPFSYYGLSKWKGEQLVAQHAQQWTIIRAILVYGVVKDMSRSNVVLWVKSSLEQGKTIQVVDDQFRTPTLAEDLAMGCLLAAKKKSRGIFHIGGSEMMNIYQMAKVTAEFWKLNDALILPAKSSDINQPAMRPPITGFIIEKARKELGYHPHTFLEGLQIMDEQLKSVLT